MSEQCQAERSNVQKALRVKNEAVVIGSALCKTVADEMITLKKFPDDSACAIGVFNLLGFVGICSGDQLAHACENDWVGLAPIHEEILAKLANEMPVC